MENNVIELVQKKPSLWQRTKTYAKQALGVSTATLVVAHANAASSIDATGLTGEIDGGKATIIALFGTALVILGIFAGWRYLKRGANSA